MSSTEELIQMLHKFTYWCGSSSNAAHDIHPTICDLAADALESLQAENKSLRNELCLKCGRGKEAHNGACDGCRWRDKT